jgi:hypothetical protein
MRCFFLLEPKSLKTSQYLYFLELFIGKLKKAVIKNNKKNFDVHRLFGRMQNSIVVHVCPMNFFYVFIVPGPILRHLGEFGKIRLLLGENTRFLPEGGQYGYLEDGL